MDETDAELVARVRQGSREAAGKLAERYLRGCRAVALAITGDIPGAEDACQDGFVYALAHIEDCRHPDRFGRWLRQIVRSHARNQVRNRKSHRHQALEEAVHQAGGGSPAQDAERALLRGRLLAALNTLSLERREVVLLHDLEGWTHAEIAERMELPAGTVRSHLHFARRALRRLLAGLEPE